MYPIIRFFFFLIDPEKIHHLTIKLLKITLKTPIVSYFWKKAFLFESPELEREVFGVKFKNPVGLGAGFDKDAVMFNELAACGFGFVEIGTLTPLAQDGNPKKRLFRLKADKALINRMGFNNKGAANAVERLKKRNSNIIIGGNIGKNKITPNEEATSDYIKCLNTLYAHVDYFVVNVSSPNTPNLRELQEKEPLKQLLVTLVEERVKFPAKKPILLKIAPDLTDSQLDDIIEIVIESKIDGLIATNTTISRENLITPVEKVHEIGAGGLSGEPLTKRSTEVIRYISEKSNKAFPIIGVGGISSPQDAIDKLNAGASLVQIYTGFIYEGPGLIKRINKRILAEK